ncbi:hypothetical protein EV11_0498 [Prochlorococcus sp. SS52]|nr:hypothetical protein EV04_1169 [Prochlorococcus marinus str. LG]KGG21434.1 hypothetical protein EV08_0519 [Prochlorococcus marinus str. SS2]KGG23221.1 hypothetical protein EV09_1969 [Prochlorococcus marinus str. SS35]KGG33932.1 hypothetical protein EV10_0371 [Prochlorococcus marinus str. SS51]KGG36718.1 hypothetical protein EV11_0498 [Prochlorococcus sp. SS52]
MAGLEKFHSNLAMKLIAVALAFTANISLYLWIALNNPFA